MCSVRRGGWVTLSFEKEQVVERVIWGRDRLGQFLDRLATSYLIEVATDSGGWHVVADSADRRKFDPNDRKTTPFSTAGLDKNDAAKAHQLLIEKNALEAKIAQASQGQKVFAGVFRTPDVIRLLTRGDPEQPKEAILPAVPSSLGKVVLAADAPEQERRRTLARWIASVQNPLTSRVMVNRIWQGHFGIGLVETASDFGHSGTKPSHPELLDWLAAELIDQRWSLKPIHRAIVLSSTYRQQSRIDPAAQSKDADVRLLWRYPSAATRSGKPARRDAGRERSP